MDNLEKENKRLKYLIFVLLTITLLAVGYLTYMLYFNEDENNTTIDNEAAEKDKNYYVYDADYSYENNYKEFNREIVGEEEGKKIISYYGIDVEYTVGMQYLDDLKAPYINLDSADAKKVNNELKSLYLEKAKKFDACATDEVKCSQILTYRTYKHNDILSVVVIDGYQATAPWVLNYHTYNFDLKSDNLINYKDMLSMLDYNYDNTLDNIKKLTKEKMDSIYGEHVDLNTCCSNNSSCYEKAYEKIDGSINNNDIYYFVNDNGKLNVLTIPYCECVQNGDSLFYLITLD